MRTGFERTSMRVLKTSRFTLPTHTTLQIRDHLCKIVYAATGARGKS